MGQGQEPLVDELVDLRHQVCVFHMKQGCVQAQISSHRALHAQLEGIGEGGVEGGEGVGAAEGPRRVAAGLVAPGVAEKDIEPVPQAIGQGHIAGELAPVVGAPRGGGKVAQRTQGLFLVPRVARAQAQGPALQQRHFGVGEARVAAGLLFYVQAPVKGLKGKHGRASVSQAHVAKDIGAVVVSLLVEIIKSRHPVAPARRPAQANFRSPLLRHPALGKLNERGGDFFVVQPPLKPQVPVADDGLQVQAAAKGPIDVQRGAQDAVFR